MVVHRNCIVPKRMCCEYRPLVILIASLAVVSSAEAEHPGTVEADMKRAQVMLARGDVTAALEAASEAVAAAPEDLDVRLARAHMFDSVRQHKRAAEDFTVAIGLRPNDAGGYYWRGRTRFKQGDIDGSLEDFDRAVQREPELGVRLWERGISYYYAGKYDLGAHQFEAYQTYDAADVENVVWRFLCQAKIDGTARAREAMLTLAHPDGRVPLMKVDALFRGRAEPAQVLTRARDGAPSEEQLKRRLFYGHLYLALYHAAHGHHEQEAVHIREAEARMLPDYMWDVAHVHAQRLRRRASDPSDGGRNP